MTMNIRLATVFDIPAIEAVQQSAISRLQIGYLTPEQIEASRSGMGLDTQLIDDRTYFCVFENDQLIGCGGWSYRDTRYGGNHSAGRNNSNLDPACDKARIRAMYTHPNHAGRGVGRRIMDASEAAAIEAGFRGFTLVSTLAGIAFYLKCGYSVVDEWFDDNGAVPVPLSTMEKTMPPSR